MSQKGSGFILVSLIRLAQRLGRSIDKRAVRPIRAHHVKESVRILKVHDKIF
jgi:hypothetical protein